MFKSDFTVFFFKHFNKNITQMFDSKGNVIFMLSVKTR
nr:MAG TPA: hypothetical protein [Caudoviricetes sp.]